jgi:tetratricopeptide (TPR) repeat protein
MSESNPNRFGIEDKLPPAHQGGYGRVIGVIAVILFILAVIGGMTAEQDSFEDPPQKTQLLEILISIAPWAIIFCIIYFFIYRRLSKTGSTMSKHNQAVALMEGGNLHEAAALFNEITNKGELTYPYRGFSLIFEARTHQQMMNFEKAENMLSDALATRMLKVKDNDYLRGELYATRAEICASTERLEAAREYLEEFAKETLPARRAASLLARALIDMRHGLYKKAAEAIEHEWHQAEGCTSPKQMKRLRLLWACAISQLPMSEAQTQKRDELLAGLKPFQVSDFTYLAHNWPEMQQFLQAHGLDTQTSISSVSFEGAA